MLWGRSWSLLQWPINIDAFVADSYAAIAGAAPDGLPTFADGLRAAALTEPTVEISKP